MNDDNLKQLIDTKTENFYEFICDNIIPEEKKHLIRQLDEIIKYQNLFILLLDKDKIDFNITMLKKYFGIETLSVEHENKLKEYMQFYLDMKALIYNNNR